MAVNSLAIQKAQTDQLTQAVSSVGEPVKSPVAQIGLPKVDTISSYEDDVKGNRSNRPFEALIETYMAEIEAEVAKDPNTIDINKVLTQACQVTLLLNRLSGRNNKIDKREATKELEEQVRNNQATYAKWNGLAITIVAAGIQAGGALLGIFGGSAFNQGVVTAISGVGNGVSSFKQWGDEGNNAARTGYQDAIDRIKERRQSYDSENQRNGTTSEEAKRSVQQLNQSTHEMAIKVLS